MCINVGMPYKRKYTRKTKTTKRCMYSNKNKSALAVAKQALNLAKQSHNATVETKYLSFNANSDVTITGASAYGSAAINTQLVSASTFTPLFGAGYLSGNKSFLKYIKGTWEIHMDNVNNEEETVNFTVAVVRPKSDFDNTISSSAHISTLQGQTYYDPRIWKVLYYKHFTLTMGGTSPGTAGESRKYGSFYIPVNKMIRWDPQNYDLLGGGDTVRAGGNPMSYQDQIRFLVHTDNTTVDTEAPRINYRIMAVYKDNDLQN